MFGIPNIADATYPAQSEIFSTDFSILMESMLDTGVVTGANTTGLAVAAQGSPNMTVAVATGVGMSRGKLLSITGANVTITAADSSNMRIDTIVSNTSGALSAVAGTPAASPVPAALSAGFIALAFVFVPAGATSITNAMIIDKRMSVGGLEIVRFTKAGTLITGTGVLPYTDHRDRTILGAYLICNTAPTGASILVDVNKNGTTIFTTQGNRPSIAAAAKISAAVAVPDVTTFVKLTDALTVDIDQVGSTIAGSDLMIAIILR